MILLGKICKISPIAMGLSLSVYMCVCLTVKIVCIGHILVKIKSKKMKFVDFDMCHQIVLIVKIVLRDFDLHFEDYKF